jgi:hypothetical protein
MKLFIRYWRMKLYYNRMLWTYEERFWEYPSVRFHQVALEAALAKYKLKYYMVDGYFVVYLADDISRGGLIVA